MKKIVGIIAALALAGSVFARPDITPVITSFTGNAKLEWIANLDAETTGMANSTWTEWKIQTKSADWGGESNQSADGMWGELVLRTQGDITNAAKFSTLYGGWSNAFLEVSTAKIHIIDGDMYFNVDILAPSFAVGEVGYIRALKTNKNTNNWEDNKFGSVTPTHKVTTAAVAAVPGEYYIDVSDGTVKVKQKDGTAAVAATTEYKAISGYQGFTLNFGLPIIDLSFAFGDNGEQIADAKEFAFRFGATLKPIDGLAVYAGVATATEDDTNLAAAFTVSYNYKIDDQFYIKPAIQFDMVGDAMNLGAALFFGWGSEGQTWNHDFLTFANVDTNDDGKVDWSPINVAENGTRTADGVSLLFIKNLTKDVDDAELAIEFYDNKLLSGLDFGGITTAAAYRAKGTSEQLGKGTASFGLIYNNTFDIVYLTARFSFGIDLALDKDNTGVKYGLRVGTKELIANTDLYADYVGAISKYAPEPNAKDGVAKGTAKVGVQINF